MSRKKIIIAVVSVLLVLGALLLWCATPKEMPPEAVIKTQETLPTAETVIPEVAETENVETKEAAPEETALQEQTEQKTTEPEQKAPEEPKEAPPLTEEIASSQPETAPQEEVKKAEPTCTLFVRCDDILKHIEKLPAEKRAYLPENGVILAQQEVPYSEGESVFDVLLRELKNRKIHIEFVKNPMYQSAYIEGIANIYEFDCGDTSGWMYSVNGKQPTYGCSQYLLQDGDKVEFFYRCSMFDE